jgi:hypothetical protein
MSRMRSSFALLVGCAWALGLGATAASAADMSLPTKAPPPPPVASAWSGFVEVDVESLLINPHGQLLSTGGAVSTAAGLNLNLYKDKAGFINNITVGGLVATDWSDSYGGAFAALVPSENGSLFDVVFALSAAVTFGQYWKVEEQFFNVEGELVPATTAVAAAAQAANGGVPTTNPTNNATLVFNQVTLSLNDSFTGWPITFNPYVTWFYSLQSINVLGQSAACATCAVNDSEFDVGFVPTINMKQYWGWDLTLKAPTYVTLSHTSYFGPASTGGVGIFTTGLTGTTPLTWMPPAWGHWYAKAGFQWYDIINGGISASNIILAGETLGNSIFVGFGGIGVAF